MKKKRENSKPIWATIGLVLFCILDMGIGIGLIYEPVSNVFLREGFDVLASFIIFCELTGVLAVGIGFIFYKLPSLYSPKGRSIDRSHKWVYAGSGKKVRDASARDVYEHQHGSGSWDKRVKRGRSCLTVVSLVVGAGLIVYGIIALIRSGKFPFLTEAQALINAKFLFWLSWIGFAVVGCLSVFVMTYAFWDVRVFFNSMSMTPDGRPSGPLYQNPSLFSIIPRIILIVGVVLMQIYQFIILFFPAASTAKFGSLYATVLPIFYLTAAGLFLLGAVASKPRYHSSHEKKQKEFYTTRDTIESAYQMLVRKETPEKGRLYSALYLLGEWEKLTYEGQKQLIEILKLMTGEDFGRDFNRWIRYIETLM